MKIREIITLTGIPVVLASLCCLSPLVLAALGLSTISFASSLADTLYGEYKWAFRAVGIFSLVLFLVLYFRAQGICTLDAARRKKNIIINTVLIALTVGILGYLFWLYVVVHYVGVWLGVWS